MNAKAFAVVANDAGASNILFCLLREKGLEIFGNHTLHPVLTGPAAKIWHQYFADIDPYEHIESINVDLDGIITGTGWSSSLEHDARIWGSRNSIKTIALIDHWVNYESRFIRDGIEQLPNEIWVVDDWAKKLADKTFHNIIIKQFENCFLHQQITKIKSPPSDGTLLYILEPVRSNWGRSTQGEFQALEYTLRNLNILSEVPFRRILLRPHPSDPEKKYDSYTIADSRIEIDSSLDVCNSINLADIVVGVESFALTLALAAGRPVYSSLPPWAPTLRLPQEGIRQIRDIIPK